MRDKFILQDFLMLNLNLREKFIYHLELTWSLRLKTEKKTAKLTIDFSLWNFLHDFTVKFRWKNTFSFLLLISNTLSENFVRSHRSQKLLRKSYVIYGRPLLWIVFSYFDHLNFLVIVCIFELFFFIESTLKNRNKQQTVWKITYINFKIVTISSSHLEIHQFI